MKFPWFKLPSGIRNDPKLKRMPIHQRYAFIVLLCLASESEERGAILGLDDEDLAFELEMPLEDWLTLKAKFRVKGLIDFDLTTVTICDWDCMQYDKPSDRAEETRRRKQEQRARDAAKKALQETLVDQDVTPVTPLSREVTLSSHDVTQNVTQNRGEETREDKSREEENTRGDGIYTPPVENFSKPCQPIQEILISVGMAEEKETPIPPTPLVPLSPENVGLAIRGTTKPQKPKKSTLESDRIEFQPFLDVWTQDKVEDWTDHRVLGKTAISKLKTFVKENPDNALEIFQGALLYAKTDSYHKTTPKGWDLEEFMSQDKPCRYYKKWEQQQARSQQLQSNTDRPMTASDIRKAETYLKYKEALTA